MAQPAVCVIFHSRSLAQLLSWPGLSPLGCLARESSYCLREKTAEPLEGRADSRYHREEARVDLPVC